MSESCTWCEAEVGDDEGFRVAQPEAGRRATFCRLEHVVAWIVADGAWDTGSLVDEPEDGRGLGVCAQCGTDLDGGYVLIVRHRGHHRIGDAFCGIEHLSAWARRGGRFRAGA